MAGGYKRKKSTGGGRKRKRLSKVSLDNPECVGGPPPIPYKDLIASKIFTKRVDKVHVDPDVVAPVRFQGPSGSCMSFTGCDVSSAAYHIHLKEELTKEGKLEDFLPLLLAPQGPLDFGPQNILAPNDKRKADKFGVFGASEFDIFEYGRDVGFFLDRNLPFQGYRVMRDSESLPFKRLKYDVKDVDATTLNLPTEKVDIMELIRRQPCIAITPLTRSFESHKGARILRDNVKYEVDDLGTHAVLVLGYGYDKNKQLFAIVKNSGDMTFGHYGIARVPFDRLTDFSAPHGKYFKWG